MLRLMQNLFDDFWNSVVYTDIIESDIQFFLDSHRKVESLLDLPACPFLNEMWAYCFLGGFHIRESHLLSRWTSPGWKLLRGSITTTSF